MRVITAACGHEWLLCLPRPLIPPPPYGAHEHMQVTNTGDEPLNLIVMTSKTFSPFTVFNDWPESADDKSAGVQVPVMPWEAACPPGHELDEGDKTEL